MTNSSPSSIPSMIRGLGRLLVGGVVGGISSFLLTLGILALPEGFSRLMDFANGDSEWITFILFPQAILIGILNGALIGLVKTKSIGWSLYIGAFLGTFLGLFLSPGVLKIVFGTLPGAAAALAVTALIRYGTRNTS